MKKEERNDEGLGCIYYISVSVQLLSKGREKLVHEGSDLTQEKAIDIAQTEEISQGQLQTMATENPSINGVKTKK